VAPQPLLPAWVRTLARLVAIAWVAVALLWALRSTTRELPAGIPADCHWHALPAVAEVLLAIAGAWMLIYLGTSPTSMRPRAAVLAVVVVAAAWALFAFAVLPATGRVCVN
jgi:hypothetical protein